MLNGYISILQLIVLVNVWDGQATAVVQIHLCCLVLHICITLHVTHTYTLKTTLMSIYKTKIL